MTPVITALGRSINDVVVIQEDHGTALSGECTACHEFGLLSPRYGWPYESKDRPKHVLWHRSGCPVNEYLEPDGNLKPLEGEASRVA